MAKKILFAKAKVDEEERNIYCNDLTKIKMGQNLRI